MSEKLYTARSIIRQTFAEWVHLKPELTGAALSFYIIFSLGPILVISISLVGLIYGEKAAEGQIVQEITTIVGPKPAEVITLFFENTYTPSSKAIGTIISFPLLMIGAAMFFFQLKRTLNIIWGVPHHDGNLVKRFMKSYLLSFFMVLSLGILLFLLIIKSLLLALFRDLTIYFVPVPQYVVQTLDLVLTFAAITVLFGLIYDILPDVRIKISEVWIGASVTSLLFTSIQFLIGLYFSHFTVASTYGAIGSMTVMFIWIYNSSLIFLLGAVFTKVYACRTGRPHLPK